MRIKSTELLEIDKTYYEMYLANGKPIVRSIKYVGCSSRTSCFRDSNFEVKNMMNDMMSRIEVYDNREEAIQAATNYYKSKIKTGITFIEEEIKEIMKNLQRIEYAKKEEE